MYESARVLAMKDSDPFQAGQADLAHPRYGDAVEMRAEVRDHPDDTQIPILFAEIDVADLWDGSIQKIEMVGDDKPLLGHMLENPLTLVGFDILEYTDRGSVENVRQPKRRFSR
jgi:hypothetical protein